MRFHRRYRGAATFLSIRAESFITVTVHGLKVFILSARMAISGSAASLLTVRHCSRTSQRYLSKLHQVRPVSFRYKQDSQGVRQYGWLSLENRDFSRPCRKAMKWRSVKIFRQLHGSSTSAAHPAVPG